MDFGRKLPNSDLNFAVDFLVDFSSCFFPRKKSRKNPPKNPPQNSPGTLFGKIPHGFLQNPFLEKLLRKVGRELPKKNKLKFQRAPNPPEFAQPRLSRVKGWSSPARGYKFGCVCSYHEDAGVMTIFLEFSHVRVTWRVSGLLASGRPPFSWPGNCGTFRCTEHKKIQDFAASRCTEHNNPGNF